MQRPRPAARLPAHAAFSMLKHAERLIQRPAETSSIKSAPHGREGGGESEEKANESPPQSHSWSHLSNCLSMPVGQTASTASRTLPACQLEELLLQQQLLAGGSNYIRGIPYVKGNVQKGRAGRGEEEATRAEQEKQKEKKAQQGKEGEDAASAPPQSLVPAHPVGRASNQDETCQRSEAREGRRRGAS